MIKLYAGAKWRSKFAVRPLVLARSWFRSTGLVRWIRASYFVTRHA